MKRYTLLLSAAIGIGLTTYFSSLPLGGLSQADISALYPTIITPAGFTFSIWSLIYLSWIVLGIYSIFCKSIIGTRAIILLSASQILSMVWLVPWHYTYIDISLLIMICICILLFSVVFLDEKDRVFRYVAELFLGWILVALIANFHVFLIAFDLYSHSLILGVTSIVLGVAINYYFYYRYSTIVPSIVFIWALVGILTLQTNNYIIITCISGIMFLLSVVVLYFIALEDKKIIEQK